MRRSRASLILLSVLLVFGGSRTLPVFGHDLSRQEADSSVLPTRISGLKLPHPHAAASDVRSARLDAVLGSGEPWNSRNVAARVVPARGNGRTQATAAGRGFFSSNLLRALLTPLYSGFSLVGASASQPGNAALMAASFAPFKPKVRYSWDDTFFYEESDNMPDGMPNKMMGITSWQQQIPLPASYFSSTTNPEKDGASLGYGQPNYWRLPLVPTVSSSPIPISEGNFQRGAVALASNGIAIFNPKNNTGRVSYEIGELDAYGGHCGLADDYHYHIIPTHLLSAFGGALSNDKPVAWALDGYPIYGFLEPDGSARASLDADGGHDLNNGLGYHYHAIGTTTVDATHPYGTHASPYLMSAFHGNVVNYGSQVDGQPEVSAIRASGTWGYEAKAVSGASISLFKNPVALVADGSGHLSEDTSANAVAKDDQYLMRVLVAGTLYDQCWRIDRAAISKTLTVTWRMPSATPVTHTYSNNGSRLTSYTMAAPSMTKLPDTSQTADTTSTFGEDADYSINPQSFTDNNNGTVTDNVTGLMWQKTDSGESTWESALANASTLALAGYTDWRLPTPSELFSIFNHNNGNPAAIDTTYFPSNPSGAAEYWWSSDVYGSSTTSVWCSNSGGGLGGKPKSETLSAGGAFRYNARYVRGAKPTNAHNYLNNLDGTVTDLDSGLMWTQLPASARTWEQALSYAENLTLAGASDWRLPNIKELQTLTDYALTTATSATGIKPSINRTMFSKVLTGCRTTVGSGTVICADTSGMLVGMPIVDVVNSGSLYIALTTPPTVTAVTSGTSFTMSSNAVKTGTGLTFKALALPTAYWSSTSLKGSTTEAWLLETGVNTSVPASSGPTRNSQGIISYEAKTSSYPVFAVRTTSVATQMIVSQGAAALTDAVSTVGFSAVGTKTFTVQNNGVTSLVLNGVSIDGAGASNFTLANAPALGTTLAVGGSLTFGVVFGNASAGTTYTAALHIASSDPSVGSAFDCALSGSIPVISLVASTPAVPTASESSYITAKISVPSDKTLRGEAPVQLIYSAGTVSTGTVFSETMAKAAVTPWTGTNADNLWTVVSTAAGGSSNVAQVSGASANHTTVGAGTCGLSFSKGATTATASQTQVTTSGSINAAALTGSSYPAFVEFYAATVNAVVGYGWTFQLSPSGLDSGFSTRVSELAGGTHGFQLYHYDLLDADRVSTLKMRFQFTGNGTGGSTGSKVYVDDIIVKTTTGVPPVTLTMFDDGLHGDGAAGDGVYGAQIPAQTLGTVVSYSIAANYSDGSSTSLTSAGSYTTTAPLAITSASLPNTTKGAPYSQTLAASGGTPNYTWSVSAGALPTGLALSSAGILSGTSTVAGTFNFTATATDGVGHSATKALSISVTVPPNIVVILTDDQGWGDIGYHTASGEVPISTPNMDGLKARGIRLEKFYATAVCSVSRSAMLTGRNTLRTGTNNGKGLPLQEHIMPQTFKAAGYQTFMCGKWHLGGPINNTNKTTVNGGTLTVIQEGPEYEPFNRGWDYHKGTYGGSIDYFTHMDSEPGFTTMLDWWENGSPVNETTDQQGHGGYSTDLLADKAVSLIQNRDDSKPMLLYLAFNAMHTPVSAPQSYLSKYSSITDATRRNIAAAVECMDDGIGRVLGALDAAGITKNTIIVFMSDNGGEESASAINDPLRGTKGDSYDGGVHTPAAICYPGKLATGIESNQYVWIGDIFPTLCAAAGVPALNTKPFDGVNLWPALQSINNSNPHGMVRPVPLVTATNPPLALDTFTDPVNGGSKVFKVIYNKYVTPITTELFNMTDDPYETTDLLKGANASAYTTIAGSLTTDITSITAEVYPPYIGPPLITQAAAQGGTLALYAPFTSYKAPSVQWRKNGVNISGGTSFSQVTDSTGSTAIGVYTTTLTLSNISQSDAASYDVVVTNLAGSTTSASGSLSVILAAPSLSLPSYSKGSGLTLTWPAVSTATSYTAQISAQADFASILATQTSTTPTATFTGLSSGSTYYCRATATDGTNVSGFSGAVSTRMDSGAPVVTISSPVSGGSTSQTSIAVQGTASDTLSGVASVLVNGVVATTSDNFAHWSVTVPLEVGANTISAVASDNVTNSGSASVSFTLNPIVPVISSVSTAPSAPTYMDPVWVTAKVQSGSAALSQVKLSYYTSTPVVTKVFQETFNMTSGNNWNGSGAMNAWTTVGGGSIRQSISTSNNTAAIILTGCSTTGGSTAVTCASTASLWPGMYVTGSNIPGSITGGTLGNTTVSSITNGSLFVLSQAAQGTGTGLSLTACGVVLTNCVTSGTLVTCDRTAGLVNGMSLSGTGLANNATVSSVTSGTSFTMNAAPTTSYPYAITVTAAGAAAEFQTGTANLSDTMITTTNPIDTTGASGYVEFYLQTRTLTATNNNGWTFQVWNGGTWNTRLSDSWNANAVNLSNCVLNPTGLTTGTSAVTCASTAGIAVGQAVSGPTIYTTCSTTNGGGTLNCSNTAGLAVGMFLAGSSGISTNSRILAIDTSTTPNKLTISANATATSSGTNVAVAATYFSTSTTVSAINGGTSFTLSAAAYANTSASPIAAAATNLNHGFQLYHYDLAASELNANTKLRFQFSGYTPTSPSSVPRVDVDDIVVATTAQPASTLVTMVDDGLHGDGVAGDGIYGAAIPVQAGSVTVNYQITATDAAGATTLSPASGVASYTVNPALTDATFLNAEFLSIPNDQGVTLTMVHAADLEAYIESGTVSGVYTRATPLTSFPVANGPIRIALTGLPSNTKHFYRLRYRTPGQTAFSARGERSFRTARPRGSSFVFTITADPHLDFNSDPVLLSQAMANISADQPDFHIDLGDIFMTDKMSDTSAGVPAQYGGGYPSQSRVNLRAQIFRTYFEQACHSVPYFFTLGNHEAEYGYLFNAATDKLNNIPAWDLIARKTFYPAPTPSTFYSGNGTPMDYTGGSLGLLEDYYAWEWGDALFVVLDPFWNTLANPTQTNDAWNWSLGKVQYDWLTSTLQNSSAKYKFLFMHHIVGGTPTLADGVTTNVAARGGVEVADKYEWGGKNTDGSAGFAAHRAGWAMPIHDLLVANKVNVVFHGHDHLYGYQTLDGVVYLECPQPGTPNYSVLGSAADGKYTQGVLLPNSGHIRVTITPSGGTSEYVRAYLPADVNATQQNRAVSHTFTMAPNVFPAFEIVSASTEGVTLRWNALPNIAYNVQWSADLQNWSTIDTVTFTAVNTNATYTDKTHRGDTKGFYRVSYTP